MTCLCTRAHLCLPLLGLAAFNNHKIIHIAFLCVTQSSSVLDIIVTRALSAHSNECLSPRRTSYFMTSSASSAGLMSAQSPRGAACAACAACACACAPFLSESLALETVCVLRALFSRHPAHRWKSPPPPSVARGRVPRARPSSTSLPGLVCALWVFNECFCVFVCVCVCVCVCPECRIAIGLYIPIICVPITHTRTCTETHTHMAQCWVVYYTIPRRPTGGCAGRQAGGCVRGCGYRHSPAGGTDDVRCRRRRARGWYTP